MWLQIISILGCQRSVWIIKISTASFIWCWPHLQLSPRELEHSKALKHGCWSDWRNYLGIGADTQASVHKLLLSGDRGLKRLLLGEK